MKLVSKDFSFIDPNSEDNVAYAGISLNPLVRWAKFILTDDKPNANKQRIPKEEFPNLIKTGIYMPIKSAPLTSEKHHENAWPLGTITHLKIDGDKIVGLAALWEREREEDVKALKEAIDRGEPINLSWEIAYSDSRINEDGVEELLGTSLFGTTVVDIPAYMGRTPVLAIAETEVAEKWSKKYINDLPDSAFLYIEPGGKKDKEGKTVPRSLRHLPYKDAEGKVDVEHLRNALSRLGQENTGKDWLTEELRKRLINKARKILEKIKKEEAEMEKDFETLQAELNDALSKIEEYEKELEELRAYKAEIERKEAEEQKYSEIKKKFEDAGIEKDAEYFEANREKLLAMSEDALEFMLQEMVAALAEAKNKNEKETVSSTLPGFVGGAEDAVSKAKTLLEELRK